MSGNIRKSHKHKISLMLISMQDKNDGRTEKAQHN
jgi:hypothetical protein